jgi:hypothetical protein
MCDEQVDLDQVAVEQLVYSLHDDITELAKLRLDPATAHLVATEEVALGAALTALQMLLSHIAADGRPNLRVVK